MPEPVMLLTYCAGAGRAGCGHVRPLKETQPVEEPVPRGELRWLCVTCSAEQG